jgi:hypothetical protein
MVSKEARARANRKYAETHREQVTEYKRAYYLRHKEAISKRNREYYEKNKAEINARRTIRKQEEAEKLAAWKEIHSETRIKAVQKSAPFNVKVEFKGQDNAK